MFNCVNGRQRRALLPGANRFPEIPAGAGARALSRTPLLVVLGSGGVSGDSSSENSHVWLSSECWLGRLGPEEGFISSPHRNYVPNHVRQSSGCARCIFCFWGKRSHLGPKKVVVLTGCDSGLGYSLAVHCMNLGSTVVAGLLQADGPAAQDLLKRGIMVLPLDITNEYSIDNFDYSLQRLLEDDQLELHALVNNAGVMVFGEFEWQLPEQARLQLEVNLLGTMSITRRLMPLLRRQVGSRIVTVTSHCALAPLPGLSVYGASKAALQAWSTSLRVEVAKYGVDVVMFIPGFVIAAILVAAATSETTPIKSCAIGEKPMKVAVDGCTASPCLLYRGTNATASWQFKVHENTATLVPHVRATVMGATVTYPFPQKDACETLTSGKCPLDAGEVATYSLSMPVLKAYPKVSLTIEFAFVDDKEHVVMCFKLPAKVVDKRARLQM